MDRTMIIDLEKVIKVYSKDIGLKTVSLIDVENKTVCTEDKQTYKWNEIIFVHDLDEI